MSPFKSPRAGGAHRPASCIATSSRRTSWCGPTAIVKVLDFGLAKLTEPSTAELMASLD